MTQDIRTTIPVTPELTQAAEMVRMRRDSLRRIQISQARSTHASWRTADRQNAIQMVRDAEQDLADLILAALETTT